MKYIKTPEVKKNPAPDCPAKGHCQSYTWQPCEEAVTKCYHCPEDPGACGCTFKTKPCDLMTTMCADCSEDPNFC